MKNHNQPQETILKALAESGAGSRRALAAAIKEGRVRLNGEVVTGFRQPVDPARDCLSLDGRVITLRPEKHVYVMLHKPADILTTTHDDRARRTVFDMLPPQYRQQHLHPVGRLDKYSTGLLILTNDGDLTYRLTHPRYEHEKEYLIRIAERLSAAEKARLEKGIELEEGRTSPATVREVRRPPYNYSITIHEGRKRQLRRMLAAIGRPVLALKRVRLGGLKLGGLREGACRELTAREVKLLTKA